LKQRLLNRGVSQLGGSLATYYKLFIDEFLSESVERIFYIDSDTLVLGSLEELFSMEMNKPLAMVMDSCPFEFIKMTEEERRRPIFNCGTYLVNTKLWKSMNMQDRIEHYLNNYQELYHHDQDVINRLFFDDIIVLPIKYNYQMLHYGFSAKDYYKAFNPVDYYLEEEIEETRNSIVVAHFFRFCGESPWDKNTCHPYKRLFQKYLNMSPWENVYIATNKKKKWYELVEKVAYIFLPKGIFLKIWFNYRESKGYYFRKLPK